MDTTAALSQRMCRTCTQKDQTFYSIFDFAENNMQIYEMMATVAPQVVFVKADPLPSQLCKACLNKLNIAYDFQQMCTASEKHMRSILCGAIPTAMDTSTSTMPSAIINQEKDPLQIKIKTEECVQVEKDEFDAKNFDLQLLITDEADDDCESVAETDFRDSSTTSENPDFIDSDSGQSEERAKTRTMTRRNRQSEESAKVETATCTSDMPNDTNVDANKKPKNHYQQRKKVLPCPQCNRVFDRQFNLMRHFKVHTSEDRRYQCELCKYRFSTAKLLESHKSLHEKGLLPSPEPTPDGFTCTKCQCRFDDGESLMAHMQSHRKAVRNEVFRCGFCPKQFLKLTKLSRHAKTHPENQKFKCAECDKSFRENSLLIEHMNKHKGLKPFVCAICSKAYHTSKNLFEHQRIHSGEKSFLCAQCGKSFKTTAGLKQHQVRHAEEKRYQCPECPSKFICQQDQIKHLSTHRALKPYSCKICGTKFTRSTTLNKHKMIHTGERPYKCKECSMTFVFNKGLRRHMRTHTGEKPHKCKFCDRAYSASGDLNKHLRTHIGDKTYICDQCPEAFKYQIDLREHQSQHFKQQQAATKLMDDTNTEKTEVEC